MNRFDESFNDVDPKSGRPFSSGHPDGVWIIAIVYTLPVLATVVSALLSVVFPQKEGPGFGAIIPAVGTSLLLVPPLLLLFRRSRFAAYWMGVLALIAWGTSAALLMGLRSEQHWSPIPLIASTIVAVVQLYIASFTFRLKKDALLS
jgi:hypothetical protein